MNALELFAIGVLSAAVPCWLGWLLGRRHASQRQVDRILRAETRFRHPVTRPANQARTGNTAEDAAEAAKLGMTFDEATAGVESLSELDRRQQRASTWTGTYGFDITRCGTPIRTDLGTVVCLRDAGHRGGCLP